jgi:hypothetical protein
MEETVMSKCKLYVMAALLAAVCLATSSVTFAASGPVASKGWKPNAKSYIGSWEVYYWWGGTDYGYGIFDMSLYKGGYSYVVEYPYVDESTAWMFGGPLFMMMFDNGCLYTGLMPAPDAMYGSMVSYYGDMVGCWQAYRYSIYPAAGNGPGQSDENADGPSGDGD